MNVNAANEDMLSESELKKLPQGGEGEGGEKGAGEGGRVGQGMRDEGDC